jgi:hypothetical protein
VSKIRETYNKVIHEIKRLKHEGISFEWKGFDLSNLFISEFIESEINQKTHVKYSWFRLIKMNLIALLQKREINRKSYTSYNNQKVIVFFNSLNQWKNIEPVLLELNRLDIDFYIISTKFSLLKKLPREIKSKELVIGYKLFNNINNVTNAKSKITYLIAGSLPKINYLHSKFLKLLSLGKCKYILIGNDNTCEGKLISFLGAKYNIKTGCIQHGSINSLNPVYGLSIINEIFLYGEKPANELIGLGFNKKNIVISGWPLQLEFKESIARAKSKLVKSYKSDILVCLSGVGHSVTMELHNKIIQFIHKLQNELNLYIIIKLHPKDIKDNYSMFNLQNTLIIDNEMMKENNISLIDLFLQTKCTLSVASNAVLESLLVQTPVITMDLNNSFSEVDFIKDGLTNHVTSYLELKKECIRIVENQDIGEVSEGKNCKIEKYYYNFFKEDYNPSITIANTIKQSLLY